MLEGQLMSELVNQHVLVFGTPLDLVVLEEGQLGGEDGLVDALDLVQSLSRQLLALDLAVLDQAYNS